ncbi:MAG: cellulase family glycosylhydrolase [Phycisphaeraceae bacterium]|nr:cellulase family glycosylhydrolase [Phycisphaeraceae bacterium]
MAHTQVARLRGIPALIARCAPGRAVLSTAWPTHARFKALVARLAAIAALFGAAIGPAGVVAARSTEPPAAPSTEHPAELPTDLLSVPATRLARLAIGVNMSHWFWIPHDDSDRGREQFIRAEDVEALKAAGFRHIRLPVEPGWLWDGATLHEDGTAALDDDRLAALRRGVDVFTAREVAAVIDVHPARTEWFNQIDDASIERLDRLWASLAKALADSDPDLVVLEILNEPHGLRDPAAWNRCQRRLAATVRRAAPRHTIICTGDMHGGIDGLLRCEPITQDRNIVYSFHFYDPHNFTHQGATWGFDGWRHLRDVPYPATREELERVADGLESPRGREVLRWSAAHEGASSPWNAEAIDRRIATAAAWSKEHDVPLYCGEFGVYRRFAPAESRERWLRDVVTTLERHGIGWSMWDYAGGFSLLADGPAAVTGRAEREFDPATIRALNRGE